MKNAIVNPKAVTLMLLTLLLNVSLLGSPVSKMKSAPAAARIVPAANMKADMQTLWADNAILTRNVILCIVNFQLGVDVPAKQLIANQAAIANTVAIYYGQEAGEKLSKLLYHNIMVTADVMIAIRNGHDNTYDKADKKWKESSDEILTFLAETNPGWNAAAMRTNMNEQMKYITNEITSIKNKNVEGGTKAYDNAMITVSGMADLFSNGIINQFPERFEKTAVAIK